MNHKHDQPCPWVAPASCTCPLNGCLDLWQRGTHKGKGTECCEAAHDLMQRPPETKVLHECRHERGEKKPEDMNIEPAVAEVRVNPSCTGWNKNGMIPLVALISLCQKRSGRQVFAACKVLPFWMDLSCFAGPFGLGRPRHCCGTVAFAQVYRSFAGFMVKYPYRPFCFWILFKIPVYLQLDCLSGGQDMKDTHHTAVDECLWRSLTKNWRKKMDFLASFRKRTEILEKTESDVSDASSHGCKTESVCSYHAWNIYDFRHVGRCRFWVAHTH